MEHGLGGLRLIGCPALVGAGFLHPGADLRQGKGRRLDRGTELGQLGRKLVKLVLAGAGVHLQA